MEDYKEDPTIGHVPIFIEPDVQGCYWPYPLVDF